MRLPLSDQGKSVEAENADINTGKSENLKCLQRQDKSMLINSKIISSSLYMKNGHLWITTDNDPGKAFSPHARILIGYEEEKGDNTQLIFLDPASKEGKPLREGWKDRGKAPTGYLKGMAVTYARVYCGAKREHATDAIAKYSNTFLGFGADVSIDGVAVLAGPLYHIVWSGNARKQWNALYRLG